MLGGICQDTGEWLVFPKFVLEERWRNVGLIRGSRKFFLITLDKDHSRKIGLTEDD